MSKPNQHDVDIFGIPHPNSLRYWVVDYKNDSKRTDVRNIWRTLCSCQANVLYFRIFKGHIKKGQIGETAQEKMKNIGDPITNTHWVDSWSHD